MITLLDAFRRDLCEAVPAMGEETLVKECHCHMAPNRSLVLPCRDELTLIIFKPLF